LNKLQQKSITSLEAAEMVEKQHSELLKDIRRYASQLAEGKVPLGEFFTESTYQDATNQDRPCYLVTKKGCEFIANKLTGVKGAVFTAKYINKFNDMQEAIQSKQIQVPQNLVVLQGMIEQMIQQEISIKEAQEQSQKAIDTALSIKAAVIEEYDDWRTEIKHKVSAIQRGSNKTYPDTWNMLYEDLEIRAHCDLSVRVNNGRFRLQEAGAPKTKIEAYCRMDVIEADPRLKEIFTAIVKEYAVKYVA
jgi:Rha family phage regulatory protein